MSLSKNEIKLVKSLQIKKYRDLHQLFVVEGVKLVTELLEQVHFKIKTVYFTEGFDGSIPDTVSCASISEKELERISGLKNPNRILAVVHHPEEITPDFTENNMVLILDNVNDPGNLGTIIRTADWFGIKQVIASPQTVDLFNPKVIQSSMGAVYRIHYHRTDLSVTLDALLENNFQLMGAALEGENLYQSNFKKKTALIMGSESHGISDELRQKIQQFVLIPKFGATESLNVAMATGILLSHYKKQH